MTTFITDTPGRIGPGLSVTVTTDLVGPIPNDDYYFVQVNVGAGEILTGSKITHGIRTLRLVLGLWDGNTAFFQPGFGAADGAAAVLQCTLFHASGAVADSGGVSSGWSWDAASGLWFLLNGGQSGSSLATLLAAVQRQFPPNA